MNKFSLRSTLYAVLLSLAILCLNSCGDPDTAETITIAKIDVSPDTAENFKAGRDLASFDFRAIIKERIGISDEEVLSGIKWLVVKDGAGAANFELQLSGDAKEKQEELTSLFKTFIGQKLDEYRKKIPELDEVEIMADYYVTLVERTNIDTVWSKISPTLTRFAGKADFDQILKERRATFKPVGKRKVESRRVTDRLGDLSGAFYTVTFVYENNDHEEVTMEKIDGRYLLLGYHFVVIPGRH